MFLLDFLVGVLSFDKGLMRWKRLRSIDLATIVMAMAVGGVVCGGQTAMALISHQA